MKGNETDRQTTGIVSPVSFSVRDSYARATLTIENK